jgi:dihydroorotate dehydrogenase
LAERLCGALATVTRLPIWVKVGPDLSDEQLRSLVSACAATGVRALVATNTWARPAPTDGGSAGLSGAGLRPLALDTVRRLSAIVTETGAGLDIVACGGILSGRDLLAFQVAGARAAMIYSALVFRGPLAGALILREARTGRRRG